MGLDDPPCEGRGKDDSCQRWCFCCGGLADTMILGELF